MQSMVLKSLAALAAATAVGATAVASAQTHTASRHATLVILDRAPLKVRGLHFRRHERVKITASVSGDTSTKRVRATRRGSFMVSFGAVQIGHCTPFRIRAIGGRGSRASVVRSFIPECYQP